MQFTLSDFTSIHFVPFLPHHALSFPLYSTKCIMASVHFTRLVFVNTTVYFPNTLLGTAYTEGSRRDTRYDTRCVDAKFSCYFSSIPSKLSVHQCTGWIQGLIHCPLVSLSLAISRGYHQQPPVAKYAGRIKAMIHGLLVSTLLSVSRIHP